MWAIRNNSDMTVYLSDDPNAALRDCKKLEPGRHITVHTTKPPYAKTVIGKADVIVVQGHNPWGDDDGW